MKAIINGRLDFIILVVVTHYQILRVSSAAKTAADSAHDCVSVMSCPVGSYATDMCSGDGVLMGPAPAPPSLQPSAPAAPAAGTGSTVIGNDCCCRMCSKRCSRVDYEFTPCVGKHDRVCKDIDTLPKPIFASNLLYENRRDVKTVVSQTILQDHVGDDAERSRLSQQQITLKRGSGFTVHISIKEANLAPLFAPVDHSRSNDNEHFRGDSRIFQEFCPYPVPEKYQLSTTVHQGVTSKAKFYNCDLDSLKMTSSGSSKSAASSSSTGQRATSSSTGNGCVTETGFYLDPRQPCETYSVFGRLPNVDPSGRTVVCVRPGRLTDVLAVSSQLTETTSMFVDKSMNCAEMRAACDACTVTCARNMQSHRGSHRCNITADDADNGESPRLKYCFSCCSQQECSKQCEVYQMPECQQIRCLTGNVVEFTLTPIFSSRDSIFACHVQPVRRYKIYDIEFWLTFQGKPVNEVRLTANRLVEKYHPREAVDRQRFLRVKYGSSVGVVPTLIEGDSILRTFSAGHYQAKGQPIGLIQPAGVNVGSDSATKPAAITVRPLRPFSVSTSGWKSKDCDYDITSELVVAAPSGSGSQSDPYKREVQLEVQRVASSAGTGSSASGAIHYRLFNTSRSATPFLTFEIPRDVSVLREIYEPTTVTDDDTLKAQLTRQAARGGWVLTVSGRLHRCPGAFGILVKDPDYPHQPLHEYDVGVPCPGTFNIEFVIPTDETDDYDKAILVHIVDSYRTIKITVFRPAPNFANEEPEPIVAEESNSSEKSLSVFSPLLVILCVLIGLLSILLAIGFVTDSSDEAERRTRDQPTSRRLLFVVCYATFRATYSLTVTFTLLVLVMKYANREAFANLSEFSQYVSSVESTQRLEMEKIQVLAVEEVQRQNVLANKTKLACESKLNQLQNQFEQAKQQLRLQSHQDRFVNQMALQYTKLMILNLTQSVVKFKQEFSTYANKALDRLTRSIAQTSNAILNNKWMAGARVIYDVVKSKRSALGLETKPFSKWAGIELEVEPIIADLSLKDFPLPNLTEFMNVELPRTTDKPIHMPRADEVTLPRNQWYYQNERKNPTSASFDSQETAGSDTDRARSKVADTPTSRSEGGKFKVKANDVISWPSFVAILVAIDIVWFVHRMARTYSTAKMILYGYPTPANYSQDDDQQSQPHQSDISAATDSQLQIGKAMRCFTWVKDFNFRLMRTDFVPKFVAAVTACCAVYVSLSVADRLLTVRTLTSVGYFDALISPIETTYQLARTRTRTNAERINRFELPFYADLVNARWKRYRLLLDMYAEIQRTYSHRRDSEYCAWQRLVSPPPPAVPVTTTDEANTDTCRCTNIQVPELQFDGCLLPPVSPHLLPRREFSKLRQDLSESVVPHVTAARNVAAETLHLFSLFVAVLVLVDLISAVTWIYLRRFGLLQTSLVPDVQRLSRYASNDTNRSVTCS